MNLLEYLAKSGGFLPDEVVTGVDNQYLKKEEVQFITLMHSIPQLQGKSSIAFIYKDKNGKEQTALLHHTIVTKGEYL